MTRRTMLVTAGILLVALGVALLLFRHENTITASARDSSEDRVRTGQFWAAYRQATRLRSSGRCAEAVGDYSRALIIRPDHEDSLYYAGNCYGEIGGYDRALSFYEQLIAVNPNGSSRAYMQIALIRASLDTRAPHDIAIAERYFDRAMATDPDSGGLLGLAEVAILRGQWTIARERLQRVEADNPMSIASPYLLGFLAYRDRQAADAWRWFTIAVGRGTLKKQPVAWTEEGDVKADPALRWRALARQSVFGAYWMRLRTYVPPAAPSTSNMADEYRRLAAELELFTSDRHAARR